MAFEDYNEFEQGEQVRKWIKENGLAVAAGVIIALIAIFGWREWQARQANQELQAASQFAVVDNSVQSGDKQAMNAALDDLQKHYSGSAYAAFGSAAVAAYEVNKNELKPATTNLEWAVAHTKQAALRGLLQLRLARVQLADKQAQQALDTLAKVPAGDYQATVDELRGDASLQLGKLDAARASYRAALAKLDKDAPTRNAVEMKLDNLTQPTAAPTGAKAQ